MVIATVSKKVIFIERVEKHFCNLKIAFCDVENIFVAKYTVIYQ